MKQRESSPQTLKVTVHRSQRIRRHPAHSLLEAELREIRINLLRLEREISDNVVEMHAKAADDSKAA